MKCLEYFDHDKQFEDLVKMWFQALRAQFFHSVASACKRNAKNLIYIFLCKVLWTRVFVVCLRWLTHTFCMSNDIPRFTKWNILSRVSAITSSGQKNWRKKNYTKLVHFGALYTNSFSFCCVRSKKSSDVLQTAELWKAWEGGRAREMCGRRTINFKKEL